MQARSIGRRRASGFTFIELMLAVLIVGVLTAIAVPAFNRYIDRTRGDRAQVDIAALSLLIDMYFLNNGGYPASLAVIGEGGRLDPWGRPYQYLNLSDPGARGFARKDHSLVPINTDYDLYSMGRDGRTAPPLTAQHSRDDIVRANNGKFVGPASGY